MAAAAGLKLRVMFQDEARFGRLSLPYACWAPSPLRPKIELQLIREYVYAYAAICPQDGALTWLQAPHMNTEHMAAFLAKLSAQFPDDYTLLIVDGASSHRAKNLAVPPNVQLIRLPPYAPELNPVEHLWDDLREKHFANRAFKSLSAVCQEIEVGLNGYQDRPEALASLAGWPWILDSF